jgi:hypothetical protein
VVAADGRRPARARHPDALKPVTSEASPRPGACQRRLLLRPARRRGWRRRRQSGAHVPRRACATTRSAQSSKELMYQRDDAVARWWHLALPVDGSRFRWGLRRLLPQVSRSIRTLAGRRTTPAQHRRAVWRLHRASARPRRGPPAQDTSSCGVCGPDLRKVAA